MVSKMEQSKQVKRARRSFTDEFKAGAVRLVLDEGKTVAQVARDLDLTESALGGWVSQSRADRTKHIGWDLAAYRRAGGVFVVRRQEVDYLRPAFLGERLRVETCVEALSRVTRPRSGRRRCEDPGGDHSARTAASERSTSGSRVTRLAARRT